MKWWMGIVITALLGLGTGRVVPAQEARVYYVAADGRPDGDGSRERPFPSAEAALAKVGGGQTLVFRPGTYRGPIRIPTQYKGTREHPTVLRSEEKWKAVLIGGDVHTLSTGGGCDWVVVDGFEVLGARYDGVKISGNHGTVRNCYIHNNAFMGVAMHNSTGGVIENNLIEFNGSHVQFHHGVYASGDHLTVRNNITRHNSGFGLHLYPLLKDSVIVNNLVHGHTRKPGVIVACPEGGGRNLVANNTIAFNAEGIAVWNGRGERIVNNILVANPGGALRLDENSRGLTVEHNLFDVPPPMAGAHTVTGDARFVDAQRGVFWLQAGSPAIGKGTPRDAPGTDFWGRPRAPGAVVDLGCFPYVAALAAPETRAGWHHQWAYRFAPTPPNDLPDLWALPGGAATTPLRKDTDR